MMKKLHLYLFIGLLGLLINACGKKEPTVDQKEEPKVTPPPTAPSIYAPGTSYKTNVSPLTGTGSSHLAVEYIAGDNASKLIITAPHGGDVQPSYMRSRTSEYNYGTLPNDPYSNDKDFSSTTDSRTRDFATEIANAFKSKTGIRPHLVIVHLQRGKLDANRRMEVAAQGDKNAEKAWEAFHAYIDSAKKTVSYYHPKGGLLIDVHGQGHTPQRTEVGYLISKDNFTTYANSLGSLAANSSIKAMVNSNATMTDLIKGNYALGTLINEKAQIMATPSKAYPEPGNKNIFTDGLYFNGGYITARHGSRYAGIISAIQLEFNSSVRTDNNTRPTYAGHMADAINQYIGEYFK